jgi:hypothetical protein
MLEINSAVGSADSYGFYETNGEKTYSKYDLIYKQSQRPGPWKWNYNDAVFGSYDWTKEPEVSLNELYRRRAQELRNNYDYLVIYYSGGYDSSNLLYAFLDNNIPIDELCVFYSSLDNISNQHEEITFFTIKKIEILKQKYPGLRVRMLDYSQDILSWDTILQQANYGNDLRDMLGCIMSVNRLILNNTHRTVNDWKQLIDSGKKLAWVQGYDKPRVRYLDGQWIFNFYDHVTQGIMTPYSQYTYDGGAGAQEPFYWGPTHICAQILIKQCQLIKKRYGAQAAKDFSTIPGAKSFKPGYGWEIDTMHREFIRTIYPRLDLDNEMFYTKKTSNCMLGNRDEWFYRSNHEKTKLHREIFLSTQSSLYNYLKPWYNDSNDIYSGFKNCISNNYIF